MHAATKTNRMIIAILIQAITFATLAITMGNLAAVQAAGSPKYAAKVPQSVMTPDVVKTEKLGELRFFDGMPSKETVQKVYDNLDFSRGVEAFLSGIPIASMYGMLEGLKEAGLKRYYMGITEELMDARTLFLTPNTTVIYCVAEIDVKDGPVVMEVPPGVLGLVDDAFFTYVVDVGLVGPDRGKGGKYLVIPPGYKQKIPDGYFVARTNTYRNWVIIRAFIKNSLKETVDAVKTGWRIYPLDEAKNPRQPVFVNLSGVQFNTIHANDFEFFEEINAAVQYEPADAFNPELAGIFASIGIKKGMPFNPDERMKKILVDAAAVGNATARAISFKPRAKHVYFYDDRQWYSPFAGGSHEFMNNGELVLDDRTFFHYVATGITPAMAQSAVGKGSSYTFTAHDADANYLDGSNTYKVNLPSPVPAKQFWSFMVYSGQTRSILETDQKTGGVDSKSPDIEANTDGSYTVWFSPNPPEGREGNWVQTIPGKSFNVLFRLYGPLEPWFDKTWKPGDFELVK